MREKCLRINFIIYYTSHECAHRSLHCSDKGFVAKSHLFYFYPDRDRLKNGLIVTHAAQSGYYTREIYMKNT